MVRWTRSREGFPVGTLSPILNALDPDAFRIVNKKSAATLRNLTGQEFGTHLSEYPTTNAALIQFVRAVRERELRAAAAPDHRPDDVFDMFCHWYVAVRTPDVDLAQVTEQEGVQYWKIAGENARLWDQCREGGFIAIGWDHVGDVSDIDSDDDFATFWHKNASSDLGAGAMGMVRDFRKIPIRSHIIANHGTTEILGLGRVVGTYHYLADASEYRHRLPVQWYNRIPWDRQARVAAHDGSLGPRGVRSVGWTT